MNEALQDRYRQLIDTYGWAVTGSVDILYTVGLTGHGLPELLMMGVPTGRAVTALNALARISVDQGAPLTPNTGYPVAGVGVCMVDDLGWIDAPIQGGLIRALYPDTARRLNQVHLGQVDA